MKLTWNIIIFSKSFFIDYKIFFQIFNQTFRILFWKKIQINFKYTMDHIFVNNNHNSLQFYSSKKNIKNEGMKKVDVRCFKTCFVQLLKHIKNTFYKYLKLGSFWIEYDFYYSTMNNLTNSVCFYYKYRSRFTKITSNMILNNLSAFTQAFLNWKLLLFFWGKRMWRERFKKTWFYNILQ